MGGSQAQSPLACLKDSPTYGAGLWRPWACGAVICDAEDYGSDSRYQYKPIRKEAFDDPGDPVQIPSRTSGGATT